MPNNVGMLYCIVTADRHELLSGHLDRFLSSINVEWTRVILVLRDVPEAACRTYETIAGVEAVVRCGLAGGAAARNYGLSHLLTTDIQPHDYVAFPDDDCYYPDGFYQKFHRCVENFRPDLIVGSYAEEDVPHTTGRDLTKDTALFKGSTITQIATWGLVRRVGGFNVGLGVGSNNFNYGEDNDYCYRLLQRSEKAIYWPSLWVWHLVSRDSIGRSSKGYLTVAMLNLDFYLLFKVVLPSICIGVMRDLVSMTYKFSELKKIRAALRFPNLLIAIKYKKRAKNLLNMNGGV